MSKTAACYGDSGNLRLFRGAGSGLVLGEVPWASHKQRVLGRMLLLEKVPEKFLGGVLQKVVKGKCSRKVLEKILENVPAR